MKRITPILALCCLLSATAWATVPRVISSDLAAGSFSTKITSVQALPLSLRSTLAKTFGQKRLFLGNPSDPIGDELSTGKKQYPDRRLMFAFETPRHYVVYVEYGPPAVHASALIFEKTNGHALQFAWGGVDLRMPPFAANPAELVKQILAGKLRDERGFIW